MLRGCSFGSLLFPFIDRWLPDPVSNAYAYQSLRTLVSWQMASVTVSFPIFLLTTRAIVNEAEGRSERLQSGVRKWLTYIALLLTAGTMIGDLICALGFFLQGELTSHFTLKAAAVMFICAPITWVPFGKERTRSAASAASLAVLASLPTTLNDLQRQGFAPASMTDPETNRLYEYHPAQGTAYRLCATFHARNESEPGPPEWRHTSGHFCYALDAAQQLPW